MKKLIYTCIVLLLYVMCACEQQTIPLEPPVIVHESGEEPPETPPVEDPPEEIEIPEEEEDPVIDETPILFGLLDGDTLKFWDGENLIDGYVGSIKQAGFRKLSIDDVIYWFDDLAEVEQSAWLPVLPEAIKAVSTDDTPRGDIIYNDDIWALEDIPPAEALALGARYKHYTRIFFNNENINVWYLDEWQVEHVIETLSGHIIAVGPLGQYHNLTDDKVIETAYDGGIMTYNMGTETGYIADDSGTYQVTWEMNYFDHSRWLLADGIWYTENGYTWTPETGVISNANAMYNWNEYDDFPDTYNAPYGENPYLLPVGVYELNGEQCTYWIETVTGQLYRHIPSIDRLEVVSEIYPGTNTRSGAIPYFNTLKPEIINEKIYYHESGMIKTYDHTTGFISTFSTDQEIIVW